MQLVVVAVAVDAVGAVVGGHLLRTSSQRGRTKVNWSHFLTKFANKARLAGALTSERAIECAGNI